LQGLARVKPALKLGMSQQLTLTPQLRQAIRLLQLSAVELEIEVREALETNPLLEPGEPAPEGEPIEGNEAESGETEYENPAAPATDEYAPGPDADSEPDRAEPESGDPDERAESNDDWSEELRDTDWERPRGNGLDADGESAEARIAVPDSLQDYLSWQLNLTPLSARDKRIAEALIEAIDDDGYLREDLDALRLALGGDIEADEIEAVRHRLQRFDPVGVASHNLAECLAVQLGQMPSDTPARGLALEIVRRHLDDLARDSARLGHRLACAPDALQQAIELIRSLDPRPGRRFTPAAVDYIVPDVFVDRHDGRWRVRLNGSCQPSLTINRHYERLAAQSRDEAGGYLRGRLQEARWLIRSLKARGDTLVRVARAIVRQQSAFLDYGPEAMRPLTLREIAEEVGVHESTVSRVTTRKYMHTPRGTFEFKHFFSVGLATAEGGEASATAIRAMIRKLIDEESPARPLSDSAIAEDLKRRGIAVARRTVAKYREAMNIPSSSDRCRLA
jgi:RNA polymerase sigma-54 factor